jgi:hypothetical protein
MSDKRNTRTCHICGTVTDTWCPVCVAAFETRRPVAEMTIDERVDELGRWYGALEIPMEHVHQRIEELLGRPVWTHELVDGEALAAEIRSGRTIGMDDIVAKAAASSPVIVVAR